MVDAFVSQDEMRKDIAILGDEYVGTRAGMSGGTGQGTSGTQART